MNQIQEKKSLSEILKSASKKYGEGVMAYSDELDNVKIESISTGCHSLNEVFGVGGIPVGRIIDIIGNPSSGKTALCLFLIAQAQKQGKKAAFVDVEFSYAEDYARKLGVKTNELIVVHPDTGEDAFSIVEDLVKSGEISLIIFDSTAAIVSTSELDGDIADPHVALQARLLGRALQRLTGPCARNGTTIIFISQTRDSIGMYGPKKLSTGGNALRFFASVRLEVTKVPPMDGLKEDGVIVGNRLKIKAIKNKVAIPFKEAEIELYFEKGVNQELDLFEYAEKKEVITKVGNTFSFEGQKIGVGKENSISYLVEHPEIYKKIDKTLGNK